MKCLIFVLALFAIALAAKLPEKTEKGKEQPAAAADDRNKRGLLLGYGSPYASYASPYTYAAYDYDLPYTYNYPNYHYHSYPYSYPYYYDRSPYVYV